MAIKVLIQEDCLDIALLQTQALHSELDFGALVTFTGMVRQHDYAVPISHLVLQHYPKVTEHEIARIVAIACEKWQLGDVVVIHRIGKIALGEAIVWVATQALHRGSAYAANEFIMDYLKVSAPFWKKECFADGAENWVAAKESDAHKQLRWDA